MDILYSIFFEIGLSSNEAVSISADDINNGSNDYSGISEVSIDQSTFD
ncbi:MAG: hypothetical protein P8K70_02430 [Flavobacteriaceae bacterium]|nr:hypothetical protein [Flavobacteriaceae bacterium]